MAFQNIEEIFYGGSIKLVYQDKAHRYYAYPRVDWERDETDKKAWGKNLSPKGTTTLIDETLEKKGLMTWPMGMALQELFGFYDFDKFDDKTGETKRLTGFSKGVGTLWIGSPDDIHRVVGPFDQTTMLPKVLSASKNWTRRQKKGADIGNVVHNAIEHWLNTELYFIGTEYLAAIEASPYDSEELRAEALARVDEEVEMASKAFAQFVDWWEREQPELIGTEQLVYSKEHNVSGTFDGLIRINGKLVLCDWKTSNASASKQAAMPEGINYSYFIQSAIYAMAYMEMNLDEYGHLMPEYAIDDLAIVSCRKDGGFTVIYASDLGLSVGDCIDWARAVITCYNFAKKTKAGLIAHAEGSK